MRLVRSGNKRLRVATPVFDPEPGYYSGTISVSITCSTDGSTIYYTTDGSYPTQASNLYASSIRISVSTTIKARAFKIGMPDSITAVGEYVQETVIPLVVGDVKYRMMSNGTPALIYRNSATFLFNSKFTLGQAAFRGVHYWAFSKNYAKITALFGLHHMIPEDEITNDSTYPATTMATSASDDGAIFYFHSSGMSGNHSYTEISALTVVYDDVIAAHAAGEANSIINVDDNYIDAINSKLFDLIGKTGITLTIDGVDKEIDIIAVWPALWNITVANGRLKTVTILFFSGHSASSETNWKYTNYISGTVTGIKSGGNGIDLTLAHGEGGASRTVASYGWASINQCQLNLYGGYGYLDWFSPMHVFQVPPVEAAVYDSNGRDVLTEVKGGAEIDTNYSAAVDSLTYDYSYRTLNVYRLIEYIRAQRALAPYAFDQDKFNADGRDSGYYGNPDFKNMPDSVALTKAWEKHIWKGYNAIDLRRDFYLYQGLTSTPDGEANLVWLFQTARMGPPALPAGDTNEGVYFQVYSYVPNCWDLDKILPIGNMAGTTDAVNGNTYGGKVANGHVQIGAVPKTDSATRANRSVFFLSAFMNPEEGHTADAVRADNCNDKHRQYGGKPHTITADKNSVLTAWATAGTLVQERGTKQMLPTGVESDISKQATAVFWVFNDAQNGVYLHIHFHRDVTNSKILLPIEFADCEYSVYDSNDGVTIHDSSPAREIAIEETVTTPGQINSDGSILITTSGTGDTIYAGTPAADTIYDLSATEVDEGGTRLPIEGIPDGNLAYIILKVTGKETQPTGEIDLTADLEAFLTTTASPSESQSYQIESSYIPFVITVTAPTGFELSLDDTTFIDSLVVDKNVTDTIYVRLKQTTIGNYSGNITHVSDGVESVNLAVSGTVEAAVGRPDAPVIDCDTITDISFAVTWTAVEDATKYYLDVATDSGFDNIVTGYNNKDVGNVETASVTGLDNGTVYYARVRAYNEAGASDDSNTCEVETDWAVVMKQFGDTALPIVLKASESTTMTVSIGTLYDDAGCTTPSSVPKTIVTSDTSVWLKSSSSGETGKIRIVKGYSLLTKLSLSSAASSIDAENSYNKFPPNLEYLKVGCYNGHWYFTGDMPGVSLTHMMISSRTYYTLNGALPSGLTTYCQIVDQEFTWNYTGPLPTGVQVLYFAAGTLNWSYSGALPTTLIYLFINNKNINWTGTDVSGTANLGNVSLLNFRTSAMSAADFSTLLQSFDTRTAAQLPASGTIAEVPDLRDTNQGGIWGTFTGTPASDTPSALAIALKSVYKTKAMTLTLNTWQCVVPGGSGDGTGFPQYFGDWWRA